MAATNLRPRAIGPVDIDWPYSRIEVRFSMDEDLNQVMRRLRGVFDKKLRAWVIREERGDDLVREVHDYVDALSQAKKAAVNWNTDPAPESALAHAIAPSYRAISIRLAAPLDEQESGELDAVIARHGGKVDRQQDGADQEVNAGTAVLPRDVDVDALRSDAAAVRRRARSRREEASPPYDNFTQALADQLASQGIPVPLEVLASAIEHARQQIDLVAQNLRVGRHEQSTDGGRTPEDALRDTELA